ncbi:MAG: HAMP domain-containing histidine kinase [Flavobacteriales bacterium]|nr:Adaptive-response sensory-kinase SasA [Flavobacteriales bacterium]MCC6577627.1 HAMP domain-containing histidine kinase [Flavobacteriales bacterium]NUQ14269.1 HAMP domain-containing histidine kinase [Flavobacteriales bacterium]
MNERWILGLTLAITLALVGLVAIQVRWIGESMDLKDVQLGRSVDHALVAVGERLERREAMERLRGHEGFERLRRSDSLTVIDEPAGPDDVVADMLWGLIAQEQGRPLEERVPAPLLDSLLGEELRLRGITSPVLHAVFGPEGRVLAASPGADVRVLAASPHAVPLFRNDPLGPGLRLHVVVPDQERLVRAAMRPLLLMSAAFLLVIVAVLVIILRTVHRQKRISDIKNDLVNNLTHELKTPISTIALACEALNDPSMPHTEQQTRTFVNMIREENKRLGVLVENVLQSAVEDSGQMRIRPVDLDLHGLIDDVVRNMRMQAERRGGGIEVSFGAALHRVQGDRIHLTNVLQNLIDNAIKYAAREPRIRVRTESDHHGITVAVQDNGIGIPRAEQRRIFDKLYRVPTGNVHNVKGFGLGLSYVRAVVLRHGGRIQVASEPGQGSTFTFQIPFEHGSGTQAPGGRG